MTSGTEYPVPVACTLDLGSLAERVDEWRALVTSSVASVDAGPTTVRFVLQATDAALVAAASLGQREKRCCAFFDVAIDLHADRRVLRLSVPPGAEEVLATFVATITP